MLIVLFVRYLDRFYTFYAWDKDLFNLILTDIEKVKEIVLFYRFLAFGVIASLEISHHDLRFFILTIGLLDNLKLILEVYLDLPEYLNPVLWVSNLTLIKG